MAEEIEPILTGSSVEVFINNSIQQIRNGINKAGGSIVGHVDFELAVTERLEGKGGIKIPVIVLGGNIQKETVQKMNFKVDITG